jgi:hypothetical protein
MFIEAFAKFLQDKVSVIEGRFCASHASFSQKRNLLVNPNTGIAIDRELDGFYQDVFTVIIREPTLPVSARANKIMAVLPLLDTEVQAIRFKYVKPLSLPIIYPQDDGSLFEAGIPVEFAAYPV